MFLTGFAAAKTDALAFSVAWIPALESVIVFLRGRNSVFDGKGDYVLIILDGF